MELKGIKNIIFDLGGVIINLDQKKTKDAFQKLFKNQTNEIEIALTRNKLLEKFEVAEISTQEFITFFQAYNPHINEEAIINAWNSMLLNIPNERLKLINQLAKRYRIFLLSNTNEVHINFINQYVSNQFQINSIATPFEKAYYSHKLNMRKPNLFIFEHVLNDAKLIAEETLFIDDSEEHIIAAKQLNLKTHHLIDSETIITIFNEN